VGEVNHDPFKRIISYQAYRAFLHHQKYHGISSDGLPRNYRWTRKAFIDQLVLDCVADGIEEDNEEGGVAGSDVNEVQSDDINEVNDWNNVIGKEELDGKERG